MPATPCTHVKITIHPSLSSALSKTTSLCHISIYKNNLVLCQILTILHSFWPQIQFNTDNFIEAEDAVTILGMSELEEGMLFEVRCFCFSFIRCVRANSQADSWCLQQPARRILLSSARALQPLLPHTRTHTHIPHTYTRKPTHPRTHCFSSLPVRTSFIIFLRKTLLSPRSLLLCATSLYLKDLGAVRPRGCRLPYQGNVLHRNEVGGCGTKGLRDCCCKHKSREWTSFTWTDN